MLDRRILSDNISLMGIIRQKTIEIEKYLKSDDIIIITGPRQSGKTTVLRQLENILKRDDEYVIYFSLEDIEYLTELNKSPKNIFKIFPLAQNKKTCLLIDEIQYLENPTNFLKYLYDMHSETIKLIVSGSSAFYMDEKFTDSLAGRKKIFNLLPLGFFEFLIFRGYEELTEYLSKDLSFENAVSKNIPLSSKNQIDILFNEYLLYGGYPRIALTDGHDEKIDLLRDLAVSYIKKDVLESKLQYEDKFYHILKILAFNAGGLLNANELANTLGITKKAVDHYLAIMRKSYHISTISPFYNNIRKELTKMPKVFFNDLGLRNYFCNNFQAVKLRDDKGELCENFFFIQMLSKFYLDDIRFWRTINKNEVDFVIKEKFAFEIKYNARNISRSKYKKFLENYPEIPLYFTAYENITEDVLLLYLI